MTATIDELRNAVARALDAANKAIERVTTREAGLHARINALELENKSLKSAQADPTVIAALVDQVNTMAATLEKL